MKVITFRYPDAMARAAGINVQQNGALKTLAIGVAVRLANGEIVDAEEFKEVCGSKRYSDLVTRWEQSPRTCLFAEVDIIDPNLRIVR